MLLILSQCMMKIALDSAGNPVFDGTEKAGLLNSYFCSMGTDDDGAIPDLDRIAPN